MRNTVAALVLIAAPQISFGQTATDDSPAAELWWDRVGAAFFSDEGLQTMRNPDEIRALWTVLSADDRDALHARCAEAAGGAAEPAASTQDGTTDDHAGTAGVAAGPDSQNSEAEPQEPDAGAQGTTLTGDENDQERQRPAADASMGTTGFGGPDDQTVMVPVCDLIRTF